MYGCKTHTKTNGQKKKRTWPLDLNQVCLRHAHHPSDYESSHSSKITQVRSSSDGWTWPRVSVCGPTPSLGCALAKATKEFFPPPSPAVSGCSPNQHAPEVGQQPCIYDWSMAPLPVALAPAAALGSSGTGSVWKCCMAWATFSGHMLYTGCVGA